VAVATVLDQMIGDERDPRLPAHVVEYPLMLMRRHIATEDHMPMIHGHADGLGVGHGMLDGATNHLAHCPVRLGDDSGLGSCPGVKGISGCALSQIARTRIDTPCRTLAAVLEYQPALIPIHRVEEIHGRGSRRGASDRSC